MDIVEANARRLAVLTPLLQELERLRPVGLTWKCDSKYSGIPTLWVQAAGRRERAIVEAVWRDPTWHSPFRPWPSTDDAFYEFTATMQQDYGTGHPEQTAHCVSSSVGEIVGALTTWRDAPPPASGSRITHPLGESELAHLRAIGQALQNRSSDKIEIEDDLQEEFLDEGFRRDTAKRIHEHYPRDDDGRLPLSETVLLAPFGQVPLSDRTRSLWLAALSPRRRRDPQSITLGLRWLIAANHAHRWDTMPWLWDARIAVPPEAERWGVMDLDLSRLGLAERDAQIARLRQGLQTEADRVSLCLLLQDAGRFGEAFALFGIEADTDIWRLLDGSIPHHGYSGLEDIWASSVRHAFLRCAPWRLAEPLAATTHTGRPTAQRLFALPRQSQARKVSLLLTLDGTIPCFVLDGTASNARFAEVRWQRPREIDLRRFGFLNGEHSADNQ